MLAGNYDILSSFISTCVGAMARSFVILIVSSIISLLESIVSALMKTRL